MTRDRSFQKEIPPSRVNIRYVKYTGGAQEQVELPLKLLLLGDYTGRPDATPLEERKKISVNKDNFAAVMREQNLRLSMVVPNRLSGVQGDEMTVNLAIESMDSFNPDDIVRQVPELAKMLEIRELLVDLKARVITNKRFRQALERIVKDPSQIETIMRELDRVAPLPEGAAKLPEGQA
ncbi:MAG TPA: type VI secretion system contractile sheath small subunit [Thermoanaerobaculaceae bacterium]|nr:type VI secretion system contractile sheath small subunit [Thermoanaerobaculaceae bacterium]HRS16398.1 type VI secretion system contractile sheath small subunit [Thermoanaerobaculaceae bacterium]